MSTLVLPLLLALLFALCVGVTVLVARVVAPRGGGPLPAASAVVRAARRHEMAVSVVAAVVSVATVLVVLSAPGMPFSTGAALRSGAFGVVAAVAPYLAATVLCLVRAVGERTWPRPRGSVRTAPVVRRTVRSTGGWRLAVLAATLGTGAVAVLVYGATAAPDGQRVTNAVIAADGQVVGWGAAGPYPGWHYGVPVALGLAAVSAAVLIALRAVTRRPPLPLVPVAHDDLVRRVAAARVLAGAQLWTGTGVGLLMLFAASALRGTDHLAGATASAIGGAVLVLGSLVVAATAVPGAGTRRAAAGDVVVDRVPA